MKKAVSIGLLFSPFSAFALAVTSNFFDLLNRVSAIIQTLVPFIIGLAVLVILWGLFNYIAGAGDEEKRGEAKQYIIWGIIGVFVMVSIWGLVGIVSNTFNIGNTDLPIPGVVPCDPGQTAVADPTTGVFNCQ